MEIVILIILAVPICFFTLLFFVAWFEKHPVKQFVPVDWNTLTGQSPYFLAVNESARKLGFEFIGALGQPRRGSVYKACLSVWLSPDRQTIVRIAGGKTAGVTEKKTILTSYLTDNQIVESTDTFGTRDLSGLTDRKILLHAHLDELYAFHQRRLATMPLPPRFVEKEGVLDVLQSLIEMRINRLYELGLARFTNREKTFWAYSLKGAWNTCASWQSQKDEGMAQIERRSLKRPGDK